MRYVEERKQEATARSLLLSAIMNGPTEPVPIPERPWVWRLAVAFVLGTLVALVLVPWLVQRRVEVLRHEITVAEPARTLVTQWQFNLVRQLAAIDELLLTGDTSEIRTYRVAIHQERMIQQRLGPLASRLGPGVVGQLGRARALAEQWHTRVREEDVLRYGGVGTRLSAIPRELDLFEQVLTAVAGTDSVIAQSIEGTVEQIGIAEKVGLTLTFLLGTLALLAAATVISIHAWVRRLAREAERRREQAAAALVEMSRSDEARNKLIRGITHDVKNPLGAAKGYVELLSLGVKAPLAPGQEQLLEGVERSIDSALTIINDLLETSRSEEATLAIHRLPVDLNDIARETVDAFRAAARSAGHSIEAAPEAGPLVISTDRERIRRILDNLITNAIKYTPPPGSVVVRVRRNWDGTSPGPGQWAAILVSDTGPGIPPDKRETVFEEYTRLATDEAKGHGLGLATARGIARRLGGDVTIADTQPGATFVLWLPVEADVENAVPWQ